jgi:hypothetical protein
LLGRERDQPVSQLCRTFEIAKIDPKPGDQPQIVG